jgi:LytS/YehU family sensor histidine kinase
LQVLASAAGLTIFVVVARVVLSREEAAVALVEARAAANALELAALRSRLEPHFLFNALNTLRATIRTDPRQARELVSDLADLYRYLLNHPEDARLEDEVEHACSYLAIERVRLGRGRLSVETDVAEDVADVRVPALLLQPLVENAVKHGVAAHDGEGMVRVVARRDGQTLRLEVQNVNSGTSLGKVEQGAGIALHTLRERLSKRYTGTASLELVPTGSGMHAVVELPWAETGGAPPERSAAT